MVQTTQNNAAVMWAESAARCGYTVHNGQPHIGVSGDEGSGHIVPVPAPAWFAAVPSDGERDNVFRALAAHALRVGQSKMKAADKPTREAGIAGVASVIEGSYKPSRERGNDIVEAEAEKQFSAIVRAKVLEKVPNATDKQIADTVAAQAEKADGKTLLANLRAKIMETGTYEPSRKGGKGAAGGVVEIEI